MTPGLRELISAQFPSIVQVRQIAQEEGMITMKQDALLKVLEGYTDLKEVDRTVL
jgi:type II secretory ATPase GspE/PulE/Tfp pilus assembly ATPase PilB-like protein